MRYNYYHNKELTGGKEHYNPSVLVTKPLKKLVLTYCKQAMQTKQTRKRPSPAFQVTCSYHLPTSLSRSSIKLTRLFPLSFHSQADWNNYCTFAQDTLGESYYVFFCLPLYFKLLTFLRILLLCSRQLWILLQKTQKPSDSNSFTFTPTQSISLPIFGLRWASCLCVNFSEKVPLPVYLKPIPPPMLCCPSRLLGTMCFSPYIGSPGVSSILMALKDTYFHHWCQQPNLLLRLPAYTPYCLSHISSWCPSDNSICLKCNPIFSYPYCYYTN